MFTGVNKRIAHGYWYGIAGVVGLLACFRLISILQARQRIRRAHVKPYSRPWRPQSISSQTYATATATLRELLYPQTIFFTGSISKYFNPLSLGRWLLLAAYWVVILILLWSNTILQESDAYRLEKPAFRAAWVTVTQIPFIYLLSCKFNPLSLLTGLSYERLNWLHRWVARTVFLTAIVHWSYFIREWWLADFVLLEIQMMPMVKYGFGAFGVVTWMVLSGFGFFRAKAYELFVAQHIVAAAVLLWLLCKHVPSYARYNVYMAIGFMALDWGVRVGWNICRNMHLLTRAWTRVPGYNADLQILPGNVVRVTFKNIDFSWEAGQHVFLNLPRLRLLELHPFTIANSSTAGVDGQVLTLLIKAHKGFSRSLLKAALRQDPVAGRQFRAFLSGPWGMPPRLNHYETVVLVASSTGASFVVPILETLVNKPGCIRNISMHWIIRYHEHIEWFRDALQVLVQQAQGSALNLKIAIHITQGTGVVAPVAAERHNTIELLESKVEARSGANPIGNDECSSKSSMSSLEDEKFPLSLTGATTQRYSIHIAYEGRPSVESMVRPPVEAAVGETAVVVCGGASITAQARTFVAALSDERAVHKGSGAQGIYLFTETYGW
ncbi:putative FRE ferric reductase-like transmembrane component [Teratosphaeria nubilosa]|uniref:ferric-chelate reductase (NADPH) n=1 Tax=Teratosphaeria nubilosa TaxID=161662 RepID=A0A6G1LG00_9PEZI|nr:putative FRE ferric reductase-like transmembrane component [Teratosphaeria nubilosa]